MVWCGVGVLVERHVSPCTDVIHPAADPDKPLKSPSFHTPPTPQGKGARRRVTHEMLRPETPHSSQKTAYYPHSQGLHGFVHQPGR